MPGTTRYSATFDRTYEEEERASSGISNGMRRSRSQSWQANLGLDDRPYTPLGNSRPSPRSSSTDNGPAKPAETIPTRTLSKPVVKTHNNPFQFVKVGSSPLYRKAEEQLKKVKEVKKVEVLKEEEEEWQSNLDSWKSRRRKMSEDVFRRQEEIRQFEQEQQQQNEQANQRKIKTFSEMVESRQHRGRTLSLCLLSSPLDLQKWELENNASKSNGTNSYSEGSEENSAVNSEDEGVGVKGMMHRSFMNKKSQSTESILNNNSSASKHKFFELNGNGLHHSNGNYFDSGLESISSSHRAGDTPDSCSDFSQDSGSCLDCDSPRASGLIGVNVLEEFNLKNQQSYDTHSASTKKAGVKSKPSDCFNHNNVEREYDLLTDKNETVSSVSDGLDVSHFESPDSSICNGNKSPVNASLNKMNDVFSSTASQSSSSSDQIESFNGKHERSIESENEVFVDDFVELNNNEKIAFPNSLKLADKNISSQSPITQTDLFAIKVATMVQTIDEVNDEATDLLESKNSTLNPPFPSLSCVPESEISIASESLSETSVRTVLDTEEENTNVVVKIKKPKNKNAKKKKTSTNAIKENGKAGVTNKEDDLNIVFQTHNVKGSNSSLSDPTKLDFQTKNQNVLKDVPPVEQVAEEMERLILQQLEEEEKAKELSMKMTSENGNEFQEHALVFRSRSAEPPKEKPPPPPSSENEIPKSTSLKRVNSTKRIKKELCKRRSNFLGIENDGNSVCDEFSIPPPPGLEQILKAEMELDRESRRRLESATTERLILEENEIRKREQEIIDSLESEERQKQLIINCDELNDIKSDCTEVCDIMKEEEDRIEILKEERKRMEKERILSEEQRLRLIEEKQLKDREEMIRKQEANKSTSAEFSAPLLFDTAIISNATNIVSSPSETKLNVGGDGETIKTVSAPNDQTKSTSLEEPVTVNRPIVPPKPLKKKEAIRKERERLRQEQEALVREREEHRRKLKEEEELLKTHQNINAHEAPVSRIGPLPSLIKPAYTPQLTSPNSAQPSARENTAITSRIYPSTQNGSKCAEPVQQTVSKRNKPIPPPKKTIKSELRSQQKMPSVKKQDPLTENKYNQNHWLIQEAEMRRITELKERQRASQFPNSQTHLAEDAVCSVTHMAPVLPPGVQLNNPVHEKTWNYGHSIMPVKKYPPPVTSDKALGAYSTDVPPAKPSRVVPLERPEQMLSVSGRKRCSHCSEELGRGAAMIIESLQLYYHIHCFQCCVCQAQLGNGSCGTDVRVRNNKLHCHNCYSNDEAGLKFSQV
ncbi:calponin homology domain-containing protein DDB_G0272472 [Parasteatoda tepidariorum]|uniref:calponin homology domain-containing protein DDB_G0272472 n=1 Tax=Parasteatoda tepidariorum TaxID=114398 RepID=UPI001C72081B|nr:LIM and calponin homology domains-containing protein 1 [Parasteatoda tepidariorum]